MSDAEREADISRSVDCMLLLMNRVNTTHTATLVSSGARGWVYFWSTMVQGGSGVVFSFSPTILPPHPLTEELDLIATV